MMLSARNEAMIECEAMTRPPGQTGNESQKSRGNSAGRRNRAALKFQGENTRWKTGRNFVERALRNFKWDFPFLIDPNDTETHSDIELDSIIEEANFSKE